MGALRLVAEEDAPWMRAKPGADRRDGDLSIMEVVADGDTGGAARFHHPGGPEHLQLFEVRLPPAAVVPAHAHERAEIIYVLSGSLRFGSRTVAAGGSVHIAGLTLYRFSAGPEGVRFLNIRAATDLSFLSAEDLRERVR